MPNISVTLPETSETISRPIIFDIIKQVSEITKINKDSKIFFPGDSGHMHTNGSTIDSNKDRHALFETNYITHIEVNEEYAEEHIGTTAVVRAEHLPFFVDKRLGLIVKPIYVQNKVTIDFKYSCPSKTEALKWRDDIRTRVSQMRDINLHDLTYQYLLPSEFLVLIKTIWSQREAVDGYGDTFEDYILSNFTSKLTVVGDLIGDSCRLSIAERQARIIGKYGFDAVPEKPERADSGVWIVNFSYEFSFDKPTSCNMRYPISVHNQLLPASYTDFVDSSYSIDDEELSRSVSLDAMSRFEADNIMNSVRNKDLVIKIPGIDDYVVRNSPTGTGTIFTALCLIEEDKKELLNLKELGDVLIDADTIKFLEESEYQYLTQPYKSIFHISLYRNQYLTGRDTITCDNNLTVKGVELLNLRDQHRIRFSIVSDLSLLDPKAIDRLRKYPKVLINVIEAINAVFRNNIDIHKLTRRKRVSERDFNFIYNLLTGQARGLGTNSVLSGQFIRGDIFNDIEQDTIEEYRHSRIQFNNVLNASTIASLRD